MELSSILHNWEFFFFLVLILFQNKPLMAKNEGF